MLDTVLATFNTNVTFAVQLLLIDVVAIHISVQTVTRTQQEPINKTVMEDLGAAH